MDGILLAFVHGRAILPRRVSHAEALSCDVDGMRAAGTANRGIDRKVRGAKVSAFSDFAAGGSSGGWSRQIGPRDCRCVGLRTSDGGAGSPAVRRGRP